MSSVTRFLSFRRLVERHGPIRASGIVTVISIALSLLITSIIHIIVSGISAPWEPQEIWTPILVPLVVAPIASYFAFNLLQQLINAERANKKLVGDLQTALDEVKQLSGLLPICANCKDIRDDVGTWQTIEQYVTDHSEAVFSHGLCPGCSAALYPEVSAKN